MKFLSQFLLFYCQQSLIFRHIYNTEAFLFRMKKAKQKKQLLALLFLKKDFIKQ